MRCADYPTPNIEVSGSVSDPGHFTWIHSAQNENTFLDPSKDPDPSNYKIFSYKRKQIY